MDFFAGYIPSENIDQSRYKNITTINLNKFHLRNVCGHCQLYYNLLILFSISVSPFQQKSVIPVFSKLFLTSLEKPFHDRIKC